MRLVLSPAVPIVQARATLDDMEAWLDGGDLPDDDTVRAFLEDLTIDTLLEQAGPANRDLLRALTVFDLPIPQTVADTLADHVGGNITALRALGLVDPHEDIVHPATVAVAPNRLAAGRLTGLGSDETRAIAEAVVEPLFVSWGGPDNQPKWPRTVDAQLSVLAIAAGRTVITSLCAADAVGHLYDTGHAGVALQRRLYRDRATC